MKKFFLIFICTNIVSIVHSMEPLAQEQLVDFGYVLSQCPDNIASKLDGKSFASLTQTCKEIQAVCDAIPTKYLAIDFSDAAVHKNQNLITRFIAKYDEWICEPGTDEVIAGNESDKNNIIKPQLCCFGKGLQNFLGNYHLMRLSINDVTVRYLFGCKGSEVFVRKSIRGIGICPKRTCAMYFNVGECNDKINEITEKWILDNYDIITSASEMYVGYAGGVLSHRTDEGWTNMLNEIDFPLSQNLYSSPDFLKKLGVIVTFFVAAIKNDIKVMHALLNDSRTYAIVPDKIIRIMPFLGYHITGEMRDMINHVLSEKEITLT